MRKKIVAVWLCAVLVASALVLSVDVGNNVEGKEVVRDGVTYIASTPFRINSNADFATSPKVSGGDGSEADPWIIENFDINGTGVGYCIYIGNTTDYFEVRNCTLHEASGISNLPFWPDAGLALCVVDNGRISNNTIRLNSEYGIYMMFSDNSTLVDNTISDMKGKDGYDGQPAIGIYLELSFCNILANNNIFNISGGDNELSGIVGDGFGIHLYSSSNNVLMDNDISDIQSGNIVYFKDDMENGSGKWMHGSVIMNINGEGPLEYNPATNTDSDVISEWDNMTSSGLETTTNTYHSYDTSFYLNESGNNKTAVTEIFCLTGLERANLSFWQKYNMTSDENGVFLQVGYKDPGNPGEWDWKYIVPAGYTGNLNASAQVYDSFGAPIDGCWNGISDGGSFGWERVEIDLIDCTPIAYRGEVRIKFNYTHIGGGTGGWYIDDMKLIGSRDESSTISATDKDVWNLTNAMAHSGNHCWSNLDPITGYMKPGIDNYLTTKPIDLTNTKSANFSAYLKFNINEKPGVPPDGFRVEVSQDNGVTWSAINLGARAAWNVSGTGADADDGNPTDGKTWSGLPDSGNPIADDYWVEASTLTRMNANLSVFKGYIIQIRFRVVTSNNISYEHNNNLNCPDPGFGGFYVDDVEVQAEALVPPVSESKAIFLRNSVNNTILNNTISANYKGLCLWDSTDNSIYHNNFIDNINQAYDDGSNYWDNGYPSGGNYWSDYSSPDNYSGPVQDIPGSDGIGDTPYTNIVGGSGAQDNYPLMTSWNSEPLTIFNISLTAGWNLVSIPLEMAETSIPNVLASISGEWDVVKYFDATDIMDPWKTYRPGGTVNDLANIDRTMGFWVHATAYCNLTVTGTVAPLTQITLHAGWNLVGYPTLTFTETVANVFWGTGADRVEVCDLAEPCLIKDVGPTYFMTPGEGYWVHVPADAIWVIDQ